MGQIKEWASKEQYCSVCGRGFFPLTTKHKFDMMRPTCSEQCQNEYDQLMQQIANHQRRFLSIDDELEWAE